MFDFIQYPVTYSSKNIDLMKKNQYFFDVNKNITKPQLKKLFEDYFKIKIVSINTHRLPRKKKHSGFSKSLKRVIITSKSEINLINIIN